MFLLFHYMASILADFICGDSEEHRHQLWLLYCGWVEKRRSWKSTRKCEIRLSSLIKSKGGEVNLKGSEYPST